ncbi:MAG TPA: YceI family protein [Steroidobacteraceae bacterium]|nr:YceI family protein [Steroidobacteraceae bacterium]
MARLLRLTAILLLTAALAACPQAQRPEVPTGPAPAPGTPQRDFTGATAYQVQADQSLVRILAYKGGAFSAAGHNHVIASHNLSGTVYVHDDVRHCGFDLVMPVALLEIDEANLRQEEGEDFKAEVADSAKQGTRKNLLSEALLDGEHYPGIELSSTKIEGTREAMQVAVRVKVKDQERDIQVPVTVHYEGDQLTASGEFAVKQSELGLKPFSVLGGALQVQDQLKVKFSIRANKRPG